MTNWVYLGVELLVGCWCWVSVFRALTQGKVVISGLTHTRQRNPALFWLFVLAFGFAAAVFPIAIADQLGAF